jgi:type II secretory pathway pseudopilin PulG
MTMTKASSTVDQGNHRSSRRDRGSTFIEVLVSIVILGTAGVAVLTALSTTARGAAEHREISNTQASLATAGDALTKVPDDLDDSNLTDPDNYVPCATPAQYQPIVDAVTLSTPVTVANVAYWNTSGVPGFAGCNFPTDRLQLITLQTTTNGAVRTLSVLKRPAEEPISTHPIPPFPPGGTSVIPVVRSISPNSSRL